ncbi:EcoAI/FtnUII family type I restriction enzme subunit R [Butyrivibrio sp. WCD3002]|uniref:EcoAI/FtnUII family type I restriction enzme subunit R n=1 Tax=Butyrivibrio sp. WCD3002 TaxID=1280676 RepID=UPI0003FDD8B5|nr:DEAD/DEAH box helicase family protein [Butyrivibrio sp. WCD3002]
MKPIDDLDEQLKNEESTKLKYITPALQKKWNADGDQIVMEYGKKGSGHYFTDGQILVEPDGSVKRGEQKKLDYLLLFKHNLPLALVEAKGYDHSVDEGVSQALEYAELLDVPFAYVSNGQIFHEEDRLTGKNCEFGMDDFPTSDELWERYKKSENITDEETDLIISPYYISPDGKKPRYYQRNAINRCINAIAKGQNRLLLVMATGTGKTFVAMQIIYRLYAKEVKKKILFLVDRNALADQTFDDFGVFKNTMVKIGEKYTLKSEEEIKKLTSYEVFISLYHQMKSGSSDEDCDYVESEDNGKAYYKNLPKDFFDLIVVDECHRGSLREQSGWHEMLEYFGSATQIGLTATPRETEFGSNIEYFGKPVYSYSLKQGIADGFLAPYKVVTYELDVDRDGYMPKPGELDINGKPLEMRRYEQKEFDRKLIIDDRRKLVAKKISDYLKATDRFQKVIVFCETEEHAGAMVNYLRNENSDLVKEDHRYVMRITASDTVGKSHIKSFKAPSQKYPVIAVTSKLLSTGVDTQTVELIVLDKTIGAMSEFKQTIGRGTRIKENYKVGEEEKSKTHFTLMDFRKNYLKFDDPDFDGDIEIIDGGTSMPLSTKTKKKKRDVFRIKGVNVEVAGHQIMYLDENMQLVKSQNIEECVKNNIVDNYPDYKDFKKAWKESDDKKALINELLINEGIADKLMSDFGIPMDYFDLIAFYGYGIPVPLKEDRISKAKDYIVTLEDGQKEVMEIVIECYRHTDFTDLRHIKIFSLAAFANKGFTPKTAIKPFGSKEGYERVIDSLEDKLF